ncbi:polysaccharide pyruvyl transferase family protein [Nostoc sp. CHAB 5784]|uniref:polysaccharide pyruvyl transferase family protein n=1 Tax=Nostoc mirabile TaxID=2907820 RepID=UPI001E3FE5E4|nr:polysaccharide pyruvyl transferase family protein [Nostoc mirabile]MCC5669161.1 polysaccharide pyruvyl transferase family protein [Nostoc mirabile CHAB5784]
MENSQRKKIFFFTAQTQYENLGDLMIIKILLDNLRKYGTMIINEQGVPEWFCQELDIKDDEKVSKYGTKFNNLMLVFALKALFSSNNEIYYILTPGHRFSIPLTNIGYLRYLIETIKQMTTLALFKIIGVRICRFGVSIGPFSKLDQLVERWKSKFMYFYSVRDTKSEDYATKLGINKVEIFPDLAWLMKTPYASNKLAKLHDEYVIFSFRNSTNPLGDPDIYKNSLFPVLDKIVSMVGKKWQKKLLISYQVDLDYEFCKDISNRYKDDCNVIFIEEKINTQSMYDLYSRAYMIFSNRLHVLMFAMLCGSIPVAVVDTLKHDKITSIFSDAGLMRIVIDISNEAHISEILNEIDTDINVIRKDIDLCIEHNQNSADAILKQVMT